MWNLTKFSKLFIYLLFILERITCTLFGREVNIAQAPFIVGIMTEGKILCTGSIISEKYILTAAHCFPFDVDVKNIKIYAGVNKTTGNNHKTFSVQRIHTHPRYVEHLGAPELGGYDLALVKLEEPLVFNKRINRVPLEHVPWPEGLDKYARACYTLGFGEFSKTRKKGTLHGNKVSAEQGDKACGCATDSKLLKKKIVCLNNLGNDRICNGDFGAPIICDLSLVAVAHTIARCPNFTLDPQDIIECGKDTVMDVFTYVYPLLEWINSFVPQHITSIDPNKKAVLIREGIDSGTDRLSRYSMAKLIFGAEIANNNNLMIVADYLIHTIIISYIKWIL